MDMPDMPSEGIWRWERRVYPQKISILAAEERHVRERERRTDHLRRQAPWRRVGDGEDGTGFTHGKPPVERDEEIQNRASSPALKTTSLFYLGVYPVGRIIY